MTMFISRSTVFGVFLLSGCVSCSYVGASSVNEMQSALCKIAEDFEKYRGLEVEISARYVSDGKHEEVLEDLSCSHGRRIIDIGRRGSSESIVKFYAERSRICSDRGASYLCNTSAEVDVTGTINVMSGEFVLDIKEVRRFVFVEPD